MAAQRAFYAFWSRRWTSFASVVSVAGHPAAVRHRCSSCRARTGPASAMAPRQATLGKFLGQPPSARPASRQAKLSFSTPSHGQDSARRGESTAPKAPSEAKSERPVDGSASSEGEEPPLKRRRRKLSTQADAPSGPASPRSSASRFERHGKQNADAPASPSTRPQSRSEDDADVEVVKSQKRKEAEPPKDAQEDLYPDWHPGDPVPYAALCTTFAKVEETSKRLEILALCSRFLHQVLRLTPNDLLPIVLLMTNKLAADYAGIELGIGESLIMKAIAEGTGRSLNVIKADQTEIGDLGLVAAKSRSNQPTMFKPKALTVRAVHQGLMAIATTEGHGAQTRKVAGIKKLLSAADAHLRGKDADTQSQASEAKFIVRTVEGKLRLGLAEKTVLVAVAHAAVGHQARLDGRAPSTEELAKGEGVLKSVYRQVTRRHGPADSGSELPSYDVVLPAMIAHGIFRLPEHCKLRPGVPLKPMLAKPTKSISEILDRFEDKHFTCEYKYDGERAQIHFVHATTGSQERVASIFSRNSEDLSKKYPDVLAKLPDWVRPETQSFVLDCETVAWDVVEKKVLPFQQLMTRKRKDVKVEDVKVKVCVFAFDLLYLNGEALVNRPFRERRELLHGCLRERAGELAFASFGDTHELEAIQTLLEQSVKASCEGLMVKMLDGPESFYEPSKRSQNWLKVKKDYLAGVGDSLDLVVVGAYYGKGKRTSWYGAFLLACYHPAAEAFETVCNIGTGFSEAVLEDLHAQLQELIVARPKPFYRHSAVPKDQPNVWFEPRLVWEVKTADLTLSPRYRAAADVLGAADKGISLRFPRFVQVREDKRPEDASTSRAIADMYHKQESVARNRGPAADDEYEY